MTTATPARTHSLAPGLLGLVNQGEVFDLSSGWWPGMPLAVGHPPFQVFTFRTPMGERAQQDLTFLSDNPKRFGFISDIVSFCSHSGTHIDALCHITTGERDCWYGDHSAQEELGDFGPLSEDASELPPYLCRGVLIDAPAALGRELLPAGHPVDAPLLSEALRRQHTELRKGDAVLVRTGTMKSWPDEAGMRRSAGAGLNLAGAEWLAERRPALVGSDTAAVEVAPSGVPGEPQPVHRRLIRELGIPLLEWAYLEELAAQQVFEFLFICVPLPIRGATGSPIRPLAIR